MCSNPPPPCAESGWLQGKTQHPGALDKIRDLETPRAKVSDPEVKYEHPTFTQHLRNLELPEKETAVLEARVEPAKDPTMKIGKGHGKWVCTVQCAP